MVDNRNKSEGLGTKSFHRGLLPHYISAASQSIVALVALAAYFSVLQVKIIDSNTTPTREPRPCEEIYRSCDMSDSIAHGFMVDGSDVFLGATRFNIKAVHDKTKQRAKGIRDFKTSYASLRCNVAAPLMGGTNFVKNPGQPLPSLPPTESAVEKFEIYQSELDDLLDSVIGSSKKKCTPLAEGILAYVRILKNQDVDSVELDVVTDLFQYTDSIKAYQTDHASIADRNESLNKNLKLLFYPNSLEGVTIRMHVVQRPETDLTLLEVWRFVLIEAGANVVMAENKRL